MDFFLFLLVNFTLFVRPAELIPSLATVPLYNYLILTSLALAIPSLAQRLHPDRFAREPITVCVLGLLPAVMLSHLSHFDMWSAREYGWQFAKVVIYYLVLISVVNSTARLRVFLYFLGFFAAINSAIAVLHYFEYIEVPSLTVLQQWEFNPETQEMFAIPRLRATGIFNDPNDLSMLAVFGIVVSLFAIGDARLSLARFLWIGPLALFFTTLLLTRSRGGMLAFVAASVVFLYTRFGWKPALAAVLAGIPPLVFLIGGRQTDLDSAMSEGTGATRIELWAEGMVLLKQAPLFGIGMNSYSDEAGQVAHNSFMHCFTELGLFGGALFLGAFWFSVVILWKLTRQQQPLLQLQATPVYLRMQPYLMALVCGYAVSLLSLSRAYVVPTYMVLGVSNAYFLESQRQGAACVVQLSPRRFGELLVLSILFLIAIYLFIKVAVR